MLGILNGIKEGPLSKIELENRLTELNRLINLATEDQPPFPVEIEKISEREYIVNSTQIEEREGEVHILRTDVLNLQAHFKNSAIRNHPIEEVVAYIKAVNENRVCIVCLRRASETTLLCALVMEKREEEVLMYHIECAESVGKTV